MANSKLQLYIVCVFAAMGGFCFGYDTGVISGVLVLPDFIQVITGDPTQTSLRSIQTSVITGLLLAGCFVGSLVAGKNRLNWIHLTLNPLFRSFL